MLQRRFLYRLENDEEMVSIAFCKDNFCNASLKERYQLARDVLKWCLSFKEWASVKNFRKDERWTAKTRPLYKV
jgi:hypothetical protein